MKGIILAAGEGKRLRPLTLDRPKCLVEFRGRPIVDHIIDTMNACGVTDITLVTGYQDQRLRGRGTRQLKNSQFDRTNMVASLFCSASLWDEWQDDIVISYGDIVYRKEILQRLINEPSDIAIAIDKDWKELWERRMEDPLADAETLKLDPAGFIVEVGKKPKSYDEIQGQYMGLIKMRAQALSNIKRFYTELDTAGRYDGKDKSNMYMTSFLQLIVERLMPVKAVTVYGGWVEIDTLDDLLQLDA